MQWTHSELALTWLAGPGPGALVPRFDVQPSVGHCRSGTLTHSALGNLDSFLVNWPSQYRPHNEQRRTTTQQGSTRR
ncbi:hypothetical protein C8R46DRAFT_1077204 [Mycena filopes]|nr:hypothetical protein C8R46DRAFT_1077204 [Mycena filopes]